MGWGRAVAGCAAGRVKPAWVSLLLCVLFSHANVDLAAASERKMKLFMHLDASADALVLSLANLGERSCVVDGRLAVGHVYRPEVEVAMELVDDAGRRRSFAAKQRIGKPSKHDLVVLRPGTTVGRVFKLARLAVLYQLESGREYRVRARYKGRYEGPAPSKGRVFTGEVWSGWVTFRVSR